ncbi:histone lysine [Babesia ovis]|uniref:Histone lysine n=1 Tax=Babesia ovis TaxID=5869 RepID=A0A9W5T9L4_BABOV|nr:histone lysine [Babesia ovis]
MSDDVVEGTLGPLLSVDDWLESLRSRGEVSYYAQTGQYAEEASQLLKGTRDTNAASTRDYHHQSPKRRTTQQNDDLHYADNLSDNHDKAHSPNGRNNDNTAATDDKVPTPSRYDMSTSASLSLGENDVTLLGTQKTHASLVTPDGFPTECNGYKSASQGANTDIDAATFAKTFFGVTDDIHVNYHWNKLDISVLESARDRGLEPTTLGHVLQRRKKLWAQTQCIHKSARPDFDKHLRLYQRQFETYNKSGDGWVNVNTEHKTDPLFKRPSTYLAGEKNVIKGASTTSGATADKESPAGITSDKKASEQNNGLAKGRYDWNNVIYSPNIGGSSELILRNARKTVRLYRNLYDCLVHGWVHPGLVVCEVKDVTHPIRFATPPDQDCYTVIYAGPPIPENATQRVVFGEYTGVVFREESLEDTLFEYAFELNFSTAAWINADFEYYDESADIEEYGKLVLLPSTSKFVLESSQACNELSLVNHYQSIKAYGGEKWPVPNCEWQQVFLDGWPHVVLTSKLGVAINPGDELVADFGALWFSKVEETAHKAIRNEVIGYRLGKSVAHKYIQQIEVPRRPITAIDVGLKPNTLATAAAICAICHKIGEDQNDTMSDHEETESDSVSCDGCDRFFHIDCIRALHKASAVHLLKGGSGYTWLPVDMSKGIPQGSGKYYCGYCRHLAKKIYMHDTGYDYMPLSEKCNAIRDGSKSLLPPGKTVISNESNAKETDKADHNASLNGNILGNDCRPITPSCFMRPLKTPTLFDFALTEQQNILNKQDIRNSTGDTKNPGPVCTTDQQAVTNGSAAGAAQDNKVVSPKSGSTNDMVAALQPKAISPSSPLRADHNLSHCKTCLRPLPRTTMDTSQPPKQKEDDLLAVLLSQLDNNSKPPSSAANSHPNTNGLSSLFHSRPNGLNKIQAATSVPGTPMPAIQDESKTSPKSTTSSLGTPMSVIQGESKTSQSPDGIATTPSYSIPTANIGHAAHVFKVTDRNPDIKNMVRTPDRVPNYRPTDDSTLVDYLDCKYLAGMWQIEPFAHFGDSIRVCTDCYAKNGPKANVYVCRLLKRHLTGNYDHPTNTAPSQMRELILMAYEQHVQMLLRLLVLKNVAIKFMCRLCCHFVSRQLFMQRQELYPPLPFPSYFMGQSSGSPEGLLANPFGMVSNVDNYVSRSMKPYQKKVLQSHLSSFVTSVKNAVYSVPVSTNSEPSLSYDLLSAMGAFTDEFSRLANCNDIVEYLNDLMSHKVLDGDNIPGQLQQMLTKDELRRFMTFRHLSDRAPGPFGTPQPPVSQGRKRLRGPTFYPLLSIIPGRSFIYRQFKDGFYKGYITECSDDSNGKYTFQVSYSDGDDETLSQDDVIRELIDNLQNTDTVLRCLSTNDMRNEELLIKLRQRGDRFTVICESLRRDLVRNMLVTKSMDTGKRTESPKKRDHTSSGSRVDKRKRMNGTMDPSSKSESDPNGSLEAISVSNASVDNDTSDTDMST